MRVAVAGASGFVGRRLCADLVDHGHEVVALTRRPHRYRGPGVPVCADVRDPGSLAAGMRAADAAYYLVHSLGEPGFEQVDARAAHNFAGAAADAGLGQIVYLSGLGDGASSAHLRSRRTVEGLLAGTGVPVTTLRAAVVIGHGGASWEMTRGIVHSAPWVVGPACLRTLTQPIAAADAIRYLTGVLAAPAAMGQTFDIGGSDVLSYDEMLQRAAAVLGRTLVTTTTPVFSNQLAAWALSVVADTDVRTTLALLGSMGVEAVVQDDRIRAVVPFIPAGYDHAVLAALAERAGDRAPAPGPAAGGRRSPRSA